MDLALTATHFPHCGLTFAILFGCPLYAEREILNRLSFSVSEAIHPLLMPGIFAEIERARHVHVVEATIDELETKIFELDFHSSEVEAMERAEIERRNQEKRSIWLDTTYLRNNLVSWCRQLAKMADHVDELGDTFYSTPVSRAKRRYERPIEHESELATVAHSKTAPGLGNEEFDVTDHPPVQVSRLSVGKTENQEMQKMQLQKYGHKIKGRLRAIIDEYDDKIRDCSMRIDGMAMATQWVWTQTVTPVLR